MNVDKDMDVDVDVNVDTDVASTEATLMSCGRFFGAASRYANFIDMPWKTIM